MLVVVIVVAATAAVAVMRVAAAVVTAVANDMTLQYRNENRLGGFDCRVLIFLRSYFLWHILVGLLHIIALNESINCIR